MKNLALISSLFIGMSPTALLADEGHFYFSGNIGGSQIGDIDVVGVGSDIEFDSGTSFEAGIGYDFGQTRLEVSWQRHQTDGASWLGFAIEADAVSDSILGTLYYDFRDEMQWSPFIGASIGSSDVEIDGVSESSFTYGITGGISYKTSPTTDVFFKVHTVIFDQLDFPAIRVTNANATSATIGMRFIF